MKPSMFTWWPYPGGEGAARTSRSYAFFDIPTEPTRSSISEIRYPSGTTSVLTTATGPWSSRRISAS